jgi:hypothetical protein
LCSCQRRYKSSRKRKLLASTHIYALHDPRDWAIRYVGKANNPERRARHHFKRPKGAAFRRFVAELKSLGLALRVSVLRTCSQRDWANWEKFWIATVRASGAKLFNIAEGGNAPSTTPEKCRLARIGKKDSALTRRRKSVAAKGKPKSPEHIEKVRQFHLGRKRSALTREKLSIAHIGLKQSQETIVKRDATMAAIRYTPEYREKMSAAALKRWAAEKKS